MMKQVLGTISKIDGDFSLQAEDGSARARGNAEA